MWALAHAPNRERSTQRASYGARVRTETYRSGGEELAIDIIEPAANAGDKRAAVLFFHGGGWRGGDRSQFHPQCERFAGAGFVAATAQYRLGISMAACVEDAVAAYTWMVGNAGPLGIDTTRIAVGGGSAGGHMGLCLATCPDYIPAPAVMAVLAFNPAVDAVPLVGGKNIPGPGADPTSLSPARQNLSSTPPMLVQHGTEDQFFPIETIRQFRDSATDCELIEYEGAGHGFFNPRASAEHFEATTSAAIDFLKRVVALR